MKIGQYRELFEIPDGVAYFNTAYNAPLLRRSREALEKAARAKSRPWDRTPANFFEDADAIRPICADLFGGTSNDYAVIPAASYGLSTAARILEKKLGPEDNILLMEQEFPSNVLPWRRIAKETGAHLRTVPLPANGDWTAGILQMLDASVKVAALSPSHWTDGAYIDLVAVGEACRNQGTAMVLDITQSLGAVPFSVEAVEPDFMVAAGYKWLLCPYGFAVMYVAPRWQEARPMEESWLARSNASNFARLIEYSDEYRPGARRFDGGEACVTTVLPGAIAALEQLRDWGIENIHHQLGAVNKKIVDRVEPLGFVPRAGRFASAHMFGITVPGETPADAVSKLAAKSVYLSLRGSSIRISPHLHVTEGDIDQLVAALADLA